MTRRHSASRAFTLVELLTVIAVITLVAMLVPVLRQARELANRMRCQSNMKVIGGAAIAYVGDYRSFPPCGLAPIVMGSNGLTYGSPYVFWFEKPMLGQYMGCDIPHNPGLPPRGTPVKCPSAAYSAIGVADDGSAIPPNRDNTWIAWSWNNVPYPGYTPPGSPMHRVYYRGPKIEEIRNPPAQVPIYFDARADARSSSGNPSGTTPTVMYLCELNRLLNPGVFSAGDHRHNGGINYLFADNHAQYIANPDKAYYDGFFLTP